MDKAQQRRLLQVLTAKALNGTLKPMKYNPKYPIFPIYVFRPLRYNGQMDIVVWDIIH